MHNPRLAARYAKSLIDLAKEKNILDDVYKDFSHLDAIIKASKEFVAMLKSPVIANEKKNAVLEKLLKGKVSDLSLAFLRLVITKNRDQNLPEIVDAFIDQYYAIKGIHKVKLTSAIALSDDTKKFIVEKIKKEAGFKTVHLISSVNEALIAGFVLEYNNNLIDLSASRELREIKKQFQNNEYIQNIR